MLSDFTGADRIYIACGYTDLRRGIDGLAGIVQQQFSLDPFSNTLYRSIAQSRTAGWQRSHSDQTAEVKLPAYAG